MSVVNICSLPPIDIKPIKTSLIFSDLSCLTSHGINYNSSHAHIQPGMTISYGIAEVGSAKQHLFLHHMSTCLKCLQRTVNSANQVTSMAPAHLVRSISKDKIQPDLKNQVCTHKFIFKQSHPTNMKIIYGWIPLCFYLNVKVY